VFWCHLTVQLAGRHSFLTSGTLQVPQRHCLCEQSCGECACSRTGSFLQGDVSHTDALDRGTRRLSDSSSFTIVATVRRPVSDIRGQEQQRRTRNSPCVTQPCTCWCGVCDVEIVPAKSTASRAARSAAAERKVQSLEGARHCPHASSRRALVHKCWATCVPVRSAC
jgi:hypothetical protein